MTKPTAVVALGSLRNNPYFSERAAQLFSEVKYLKTRPGPDDMVRLLGEYDVIIVGVRERIDARTLANVPDLRTTIVGTLSIGVDHLDLNALAARGITTISSPTANVRSVAEHNVALILALTKRLKAGDLAAPVGGRAAMGGVPLEIDGKVAGLVGYGKIGRATAPMLRALGMRVLATSRSLTDGSDGVVAFRPLRDLLAESFAVVLALPLTSESRGLLDQELLDLVAAGSLVVNTCRAELVDHTRVRERLADGSLLGFGADYDDDPHGLSEFPNAIVTPHVAGLTSEANDRIDNELIDRIQAFLEGR